MLLGSHSIPLQRQKSENQNSVHVSVQVGPGLVVIVESVLSLFWLTVESSSSSLLLLLLKIMFCPFAARALYSRMNVEHLNNWINCG